MRYGIDEHSRYEEINGERIAVEPAPSFWRWRLLKRFQHRAQIVRWHIGIMRQHGLAEWNRLRKF